MKKIVTYPVHFKHPIEAPNIINDAPSDDKSYIRKNNSWEEIQSENLVGYITSPDNKVWGITITDDGELDTYLTPLQISMPEFYRLTSPNNTVWEITITNDGNLKSNVVL